jgi:hypothetical protein
MKVTWACECGCFFGVSSVVENLSAILSGEQTIPIAPQPPLFTFIQPQGPGLHSKLP